MYKFISILSFSIFAYSVNAQFPTINDLIILKSGKELRCEILNRTDKDSLRFRVLEDGAISYIQLSDIGNIYLERWSSIGVIVGRRPMNYTFKDGVTVGCDVLVLTNGSKIRGIVKEKPTEDSITIYVPFKERPVTVARESVVQRKSEISKRQPSEYQSWLRNGNPNESVSPHPKLIEEPAKSGMSYISLSYNFLIPMGDFARTDFATQFTSNPNKPNELAFAKNGFSVGMDGAFLLDSNIHIGIATSIRLQFNDFNSAAFASNSPYVDPFTGLMSKASVNDFTYKSNLYMMGVAFSLPLGRQQKVAFDSRLLAGVSVLSLTQPLKITYDISSQPISIMYSTKNTSTCYGLEAGFRFFLGPSFALGIKAGYTTANFQGIPVSGAMSGTVLNVTKSDAHINNVNIGVSLSFCY